MEFTLYYRGPLKANAGPGEKHTIRCEFSSQLQHLWNLKGARRPGRLESRVFPSLEMPGLTRQVGALRFAACVTEGNVAEIDLTLLRPELPGSIVSRGGDLDNRLKTLLDSLRMPNESSQLPRDLQSGKSDDVIFCVLQDDRFITRLSVNAFQFLLPGVPETEVVAILNVRTRHVSEFEGKLGMLDGPGVA